MSSVKAGSRRRENRTGQRAERKDQAKAWSFLIKNSFFRNIKVNISDFFYSIKLMLTSLWSEKIKEK